MPCRTHTSLQPRHVGAVVAVAAVLVLDLHHQDRAALRDEQRLHDLREASHVAFGRCHVARVEAADLEVGVAQQVRRDAAEVPLGADVRARAAAAPTAPRPATSPDEARDVAVAGREVEHALGGLVVVPEDVGRDRVAAHRLRHADAMAPVLRRDARRVHLAGDHLERLAVEQEVVAPSANVCRAAGPEVPVVRTSARAADSATRTIVFMPGNLLLFEAMARLLAMLAAAVLLVGAGRRLDPGHAGALSSRHARRRPEGAAAAAPGRAADRRPAQARAGPRRQVPAGARARSDAGVLPQARRASSRRPRATAAGTATAGSSPATSPAITSRR